MDRVLDGIKVLDFSKVLAGPTMTQALSDLGAEIIKIERPDTGCDERVLSPFKTTEKGTQSGYFMVTNRGKKSFTLDIANPEALPIIEKLTKWADIVVENFVPGTAAKFGIDYESLRKINPKIIMISISIFGQGNALSRRPGYDIIGQAYSGILWMTGEPDRVPMRCGSSIGDILTYSYGLAAVCSALYYRDITGIGQYIDSSLRDNLAAGLGATIPRYFYSKGKDRPKRHGAHDEYRAPHGIFKGIGDEYMAIVADTNDEWLRLMDAMGHPDALKGAEFNTAESRHAQKDLLISEIEGWISGSGGCDAALSILKDHKVPAVKVLPVDEMLADPSYVARHNLTQVIDPIVGQYSAPACAIRYSDTSSKKDVPCANLGADTEPILRDLLGYTEQEIAALREHKVICT